MINRQRIAEFINTFGEATLSLYPPVNIQGKLPEDADIVCITAHEILGYMKEFMKGRYPLYNLVWVLADQKARHMMTEQEMDARIKLHEDGKLEALEDEVDYWRTASSDAHLAIEVYGTAHDSLLKILCDEN